MVALQMTIVLPNFIRQEFSTFVNKSKDIETFLISLLNVFISSPVNCLRYAFIKNYSLKSKLILQVHDELVFDVPLGEVDLIKKIIIDKMENAYILKVPLTVDLGVGNNWLEAH